MTADDATFTETFRKSFIKTESFGDTVEAASSNLAGPIKCGDITSVASAPGKIHLIGEHAVVYGEPAIFAAIGMRTLVKAEKSGKVRYMDSRWGHDNSWDLDEVISATDDVIDLWKVCAEKNNFSELFSNIKANRYENYKKAVIGIALNNLGVEHGVSIKIDSELPAGAGLGSSASLAVAVVKAIAAEYGINKTNEEVNSIAYEMEKLIHGTPSGGDNSACCYGGLIWFQWPNTVLSLKEEIPYPLENFVLVYTKKPEKTTGELVQLVRDMPDSFRSERVKTIGKAVSEMREALKRKDFEKVKELINLDQRCLKELGVSVPEIDRLADEIKAVGGAAKLCGGGGGGVVLCYHKDKQKMLDKINELGFKFWEAELGVEGVRNEN